MSFEITCPYCFKTMRDDEVLFRSEKVNQGDNDILPDDYDDLEDFQARYRGRDKEVILSQLRDWEFFQPKTDSEYNNFWRQFNGTTEVDYSENLFHVKAFERPIIDPSNSSHQHFIRKQSDSSFFIRDAQGMVSQIELVTGEKCNRRVCRHCHNPLPDNYGKSPVRFVPIIGITGAGKTVYLSQLLKRMKHYASKVGLDATVTTASSRAFVENNLIKANYRLPGSTPANRLQQPLFYDIVRNIDDQRKVTETFVLYDVAGEVFDEKKSNAATIDCFAPFVRHAHGIIILLDPLQFEVFSSLAPEEKQLSETTVVLEKIHYIITNGNTEEKSNKPLAMCISKIDMQIVQSVLTSELRNLMLDDVQYIADHDGIPMPLFNAEQYNPVADELNAFFKSADFTLSNKMRTNYTKYCYFGFTALGCDIATSDDNTYQYPKGPILPKRIEEPMLWLFHEFGYIEANTSLHYPNKKIIKCPKCKSERTYELAQDKQTMVVGRFFNRKKVHVDRGCATCGHKWDTLQSKNEILEEKL